MQCISRLSVNSHILYQNTDDWLERFLREDFKQILQWKNMRESVFDKSSVKLDCGCMVDAYGDIKLECLPHSQGNFTQ